MDNCLCCCVYCGEPLSDEERRNTTTTDLAAYHNDCHYAEFKPHRKPQTLAESLRFWTLEDLGELLQTLRKEGNMTR